MIERKPNDKYLQSMKQLLANPMAWFFTETIIRKGQKLLDDATVTETVEQQLKDLKEKLKWLYCLEIGSDSTVGLDCCDNFKDWCKLLKGGK